MAEVTIYFDTNGTPPSGGYIVTYREKGSSGSYLDYGSNFFFSPAILELPDSTVGYEGFIGPMCDSETTTGTIPWTT